MRVVRAEHRVLSGIVELDCAYIGGDNFCLTGPSLKNRHAETFVKRWKYEDIGATVESGKIFIGNVTKTEDALSFQSVRIAEILN